MLVREHLRAVGRIQMFFVGSRNAMAAVATARANAAGMAVFAKVSVGVTKGNFCRATSGFEVLPIA